MDNTALLQEVTAKAQVWLNGNFDEDTKKEVKALLDSSDKNALIDAFYRDLEFGTGGLRGIMGAGTNRMNKYVVGMATQGFANYLKKNFADRKQISVVVGHDCRNNSRLFAETVADIFSANGIQVYLFESLRPTPEISFAIRQLKAQAGVNVTASHNPREYNGYKAYWEDGAQVLAPHDKGIIDEVNKVKVEDVKFAGNKDLIKIIGGEMDFDYMTAVHEALIDQDVINRQKDLNIVYSAMHGTGRVIVPLCLRSWGFQNINVVPEQMVVDGNFPTVVSPNPENAEAMTLGMKLGTKLNADLVVATDPDADRLAIVCRDNKGEWMIINGNQTAMMFCYYIITNMKKLGKMTGNEFLVKTIVTTEVIAEIAKKNNIELRDCYTGFKWIAREIAISEGKKKYIGGGEESFGFLPFDKVRDKDAPASICLICEIAAWAKDQGKTLYDLLMQIYQEYGFSKEFTINVTKPGKSGADEIKAMMEGFRANPPKDLGGSKVSVVKDFKTLEMTTAAGKQKLDMPETSNVLQWFCEDGTKVSVRPSGTEPKIKFYCEVKGTMKSAADYAEQNEKATAKIEAIKKSLGL
ncbi:MAG: phospho-sugar mutase [Paludibacteraceae bacterium]|jgi:phosphoglucomutase|nr:phospho-sugar mutase [Paludibacteraceae bacterium]MDD5996511.1 phospho-sugar mutase [Bacteroidales bacterium]MBQ6561927.1 phospho-sugar mutase [Paludibacteraceae bacterium]MBQ8019128.1 phospho-sugar mutase [Paludibacteraceae bacterium]MBR6111493.1 phospho-sugar mutase [Paludibacteraceae bacterium]